MDDALSEAKYRLMLEQETRKWSVALEQLNNATQNLVREMQALKAMQQSLQQELMQIKAKPKAETQKILPAEEKPASHPRQGNFTSEDVDLQKMFYFGRK